MAKFSNVKIPSANSDKKRLNELFESIVLKDNVYKKIRIIGEVFASAEAWVDIKTKTGKKVSIPKYSRDLNPVTSEFEENGCPYRRGGINFKVVYYVNVIDRSEQDNEPRKKKDPTKEERKSGFKNITSETWTPVRVMRIPSSVATMLQGFSETNTKQNKKTGETKSYDIGHEKYGRDVLIKVNRKSKNPSQMYSLEKDSRTPLTEEETSYLVWDIDSAIRSTWESTKNAEREWERLQKSMIVKKESDEDENEVDLDDEDAVDIEDIDEKKSKKDKKKSKKDKSKKKKSKKDFDVDDLEDDED